MTGDFISLYSTAFLRVNNQAGFIMIPYYYDAVIQFGAAYGMYSFFTSKYLLSIRPLTWVPSFFRSFLSSSSR